MIGILSYFILSLGLGLGLMAFVASKSDYVSLAQRYTFAACLGPGVVFLLSIYQLAFMKGISLYLLWTAMFLSWLLALISKFPLFEVRLLRNRVTSFSIKSFSRYEWVFISFIFIQISYVILILFWKPVVNDDDLYHFAGGAKQLYYHGIVDRTWLAGKGASKSYPLFIAINEVVFSKMLGYFDDFLCSSFLVIYFLSFISVVYTHVSGFSSRIIALFAVFIMLSMPKFLTVGFYGMAEVPMSISIALYTICFLKYYDSGKLSYLILSGFFGGHVASTKAEGPYVLLIFILVFLVSHLKNKKIKISHLPILLAIFFFFVFPWSYIKWINGMTLSRWASGAHNFNWIFNIGTYSHIFRMVTSYSFTNYRGFHAPNLWYSLLGNYFYLALLYWLIKNRRDESSLCLVLIIFGISATYIIGCFYTGAPGQLGRILVGHTTGLAMLFIIEQIHDCFGRDTER